MRRVKKAILLMWALSVLMLIVMLSGCGEGVKELTSPQNLRITDGILTWEEAEGAESYSVMVDGIRRDTTDCRFDLFEVVTEPKVYEIEVLSRSGREGEEAKRSEKLEYDLSETGYYAVNEFEKGVYELKVFYPEKISGTVVLPSEMSGKPIVRLAKGAFKDCEKVTAVYIPDGITEMKSDVFNGCCNLRRVRFSPDMSVLAGGTFTDCISLEQVELPEWVTEIQGHAFSGCSSLKTVEIPEGVTEIGDEAFGNSGLTEIYIPGSVKIIDETWNLFRGCKNLQKIEVSEENEVYYAEGNCLINRGDRRVVAGCDVSVIPEGIEEIGERAFSGCGFESIELPETLVSIGRYAFSGCENLLRINIPDAVSVLENGCFSSCKNLEEVTGMNGVETIQTCAFSWCESLEEIELPRGLTRLGRGVFLNSGLRKFFLPEGVIEIEETEPLIGENLFSGCPDLTEIECDENNAFFYAEGNCLIRRADQSVLAGCKTSEIPEGIERIEACAFNYSYVTEIVLPTSLREIGHSSFYCCAELSLVAIPEGVVLIDNYAFDDCPELQALIMPESVVTVGMGAFADQAVYFSKGMDLSGWYSRGSGKLIPCIFAYEGKYPYVYSIDISDQGFIFPLNEEKFLVDEYKFNRFGIYENYIKNYMQGRIMRYMVPQPPNLKEGSTRKFLGWTTEEGSERVEYPVREYAYTIVSNIGSSPFDGMTFIKYIWIETEEFSEFLDRYYKEDYRPVLYAVYG